MRKKLRLALDALAVESFVAVEEAAGHGTVAGHDSTEADDGCSGLPDTCYNTCYPTCYNTCLRSCAGTCRWQTCNTTCP